MTSNERRQKTRIPLESKLKHSKYQVLGTPVFQEDSVIDVSTGGVAFESSVEYAEGTLVLLELPLKDQHLKILVSVAWVRQLLDGSERFQVGGELIAIDPEHKIELQKTLGQMIRQMAKKAKKPSAKNAKSSSRKNLKSQSSKTVPKAAKSLPKKKKPLKSAGKKKKTVKKKKS